MIIVSSGDRYERPLDVAPNKIPARAGIGLFVVGAIGLEPTTPTMSRWCSNQLSYAPKEPVRYAKPGV
jgi:hypothetical protein